MRSFSISATLIGATWLLLGGACIPDAVLIDGGSGGSGTGSGTGTGTGTESGTASGTSSGTGSGTGTGMPGCETASDCPGMDTTCQTRTCTDGACGFDVTAESVPCTEDGGQLCDGEGQCVECLVDAHCTDNPPCINKVCGVKLDNGEACTENSDCTSDQCVEGVCCDTACGGACESCLGDNTCGDDGTCAPVTAGTDPDGECNAMQACFGGSCGFGKVVFVSSGQYNGALGGLAGADQLCMNHAALGCLTGTYMAWLSTETESPSTRFTQENIPYRLVDGTVVANGFSDLTDGQLATPIDLDELGNAGPTVSNINGCDPDLAWSGTDPDGTTLTEDGNMNPLTSANRCEEWTVTTADGQWGRFGAQTGNWSQYCTGNGGSSCNLEAALYCVEQ